jgi:hypothetical protein
MDSAPKNDEKPQQHGNAIGFVRPEKHETIRDEQRQNAHQV